jgi:hypothetical protein
MAALLRGLAVRSEADLDQRQRLQKVFFPEGVSFDGKELRTPLTCPFFNNFEGTSGSSERLVARTGSTWNPVVAQLTAFEALKDALVRLLQCQTRANRRVFQQPPSPYLSPGAERKAALHGISGLSRTT